MGEHDVIRFDWLKTQYTSYLPPEHRKEEGEEVENFENTVFQEM